MDNKNNNKNNTKTNREQAKFIHEMALAVEANRLLTVRLRLAAAFQTMWITAYDALLHHEVNVRELPEYKDDGHLNAALDGDLTEGEGHIMAYLQKVTSGITAAIRRKSFRKV